MTRRLTPSLALTLAITLTCCATPPPAAPAAEAPETTRLRHLSAEVEIRGSLDDRPVQARGVARWRAVWGERGTLTLDAEDMRVLDVKALSADGRALPATWTHEGGRLSVKIPSARPGQQIEAVIRYHATPTRGVGQGGGALWMSFHTWRWVPASRDPSQRATLALHVTAPERQGAVVLATGDGPARPGPDAASETPHPSYLWGFVIGDLKRAAPVKGEPLALTTWSPDAAHPGVSIARQRTIEAWRRARRAGAPWPKTRSGQALPYTQVFVPGRAAQELAGMTFIGARTLDALYKDPDADWLIVHELAHEVWGNRVTCATWGDFWINEAVVVRWVARDKALRGDAAGAAREVMLWQQRVQRALARGDDARIARPGATPATAGGAIPYYGGALRLQDVARRRGDRALDEALNDLMREALRGGSLALTTEAFLARVDPGAPAQLIAR